MKVIIAIAVLALAAADAKYIYSKCPSIPTGQATLDATFFGTWYEQFTVKNLLETGQTCQRTTVTAGQNGTVDVVHYAKAFGRNLTIDGVGYLPDPQNNTGMLTIRYNRLATATYFYLDTNSTQYTVSVRCQPLGPFVSSIYGWIWTRSPGPMNADDQTSAINLLRSQGVQLSDSDIVQINQSDC